MYQKTYHIHFVGVGGIGMSGIAELLINLGYRVSGSDIRESDITERLKDLGGKIHIGHAADQVKDADVVVVSSAVKKDNPEVVAANEASIPVIPRAEMLAELMRLKYSIAVAGAHGKTSTTSIVSAVLDEGNLDPTVVIGGKLKSLGTNAVLGEGDFIVAEADESDGSFLKMTPSIAVVTNIDREHLDYYKDLNAIKDAFLSFIDRIPFYGLAVLCLDDESIQTLLPGIKKRFVTYGLTPQADVRATEIKVDGLKTAFTVMVDGEKKGGVNLNLPGIHNVYNSLAGIAVGLELDIPFENIKAALEKLEGVQRRLEIKGEINGITVIDDYGHHPTEIKTTLAAVRESYPNRRMAVVFQPHRYSRTKALFREFTRSFYESDILIGLPIYAAGETPIEGVEGKALFESIRSHGHKQVHYYPGFDEALSYLKDILEEGDIVLTLGAGDVFKLGVRLLDG